MALVDGRAGGAASEQRRSSILDAALEVFTAVGYQATTVAEIRRRTRVTTGSLYHYFPGGKPEIAAAVHVDSLRQYQSEFLPVLAAVGDDAEAGIRAGVQYHLDWIDAHPGRARFIFSDHPREVGAALRQSVRELNAEFFAAIGGWIDRQIDAGAIRPLPKRTLYALWVGPAQQIGRQLVSSQRRLRLRDTIDALSDGAWRAMRADPTPTA